MTWLGKDTTGWIGLDGVGGISEMESTASMYSEGTESEARLYKIRPLSNGLDQSLPPNTYTVISSLLFFAYF